MKKREKILLILTLIVAVYALMDFFILSKTAHRPDTRRSITHTQKNTGEFVTRSMARISKIDQQIKQPRLQTLISKIESDWDHDPFVQPLKSDPLEVVSSPSLPVSDFVYSGYMSVGDILFAVINGVEYRTGEIMPENGVKVINITPQRVILQRDTEQAVIFLKEE